MFAKLYETEIGQILVLLQGDDEAKPEVRYFFEPVDLGVCSFALKYEDTDDGWDKAESIFEQTTREIAVGVVGKIMKEYSLAS